MCKVTHPLVAELRREAASGNGYHLGAPADGLELPPATEISEPLKWHGGKQPIARRIIALVPAHTTYVEPYAGGLAVLLAKPAGDVSEIVNDVDARLMNFWTALREPKLFAQLRRMAEATPFCEATWRECEKELDADDPARRAWAFFVRCRQSLAGRMKSFSPLSVTRTRRGMNEQASAWLSAVEGLPAVHERLKRVAVLNRDALSVIQQHDSPDTLFYCDPPYLPESRTAPDVYAHEMTFNQHVQLLELLKLCKGKVILSGYPNRLYDDTLDGWQRIEIDRANSAAGGDRKRRMTEVLWMNFELPAQPAAERLST
ncbi:MAG: DNA adenine methylase [Betaproteobacteria bacterium]|nr:DNA adenine methylase [Betaproteobacteria bacterium]